MDRDEAHRATEQHLPAARRHWWDRRRCSECGERYPCRTLQAALDELTKRWFGRRP